MGWMTEESWFDSRQRSEICLFSEGPWPVPIFKQVLCSMGTEFSSQRPKRLKLECGHLYLHIAGFKNAWCYTSTPPYALMAWFLIKNRDNFTFKISIENMADKRNCEKGSTLAMLILCTEIICGNGPWSNMQIFWGTSNICVECKITTWRPYINYQLWCTDYHLFIKYYSPLYVSSLKCSSSGGYSCTHAAYGTVTFYESSWWPVGTQLEW